MKCGKWEANIDLWLQRLIWKAYGMERAFILVVMNRFYPPPFSPMPLPITLSLPCHSTQHSSHYPSTHITLHFITLFSNRRFKGFWFWVKISFAKSQIESFLVLGVLCPLDDAIVSHHLGHQLFRSVGLIFLASSRWVVALCHWISSHWLFDLESLFTCSTLITSKLLEWVWFWVGFDGCCHGGGVWWLWDRRGFGGCWIGVVLVARLVLGFGHGYGWCWVCLLMSFGDVLAVSGDCWWWWVWSVWVWLGFFWCC